MNRHLIAVCAGLAFALTTGSARAQYYFWWTGYSPVVRYQPVTTYRPTILAEPCCNTTRMAAYNPPMPACCVQPGSCCSSGCATCCRSDQNVVTAGTSSAVSGQSSGDGSQMTATQTGTSAAGTLTRVCKTCTVGDARVLSGPKGLLYVDGERGYFQMTWGGELQTGDLQYRRQDESFRYYEALSPTAAEPAQPREWAIAKKPCSQCKYAVWFNHNEAGNKAWSKVQSAEQECVKPLVPISSENPGVQLRLKPESAVENYDGQRRGKSTTGTTEGRWKTVPPRTSKTRSVAKPRSSRQQFLLQSARETNQGWHAIPETRLASQPTGK